MFSTIESAHNKISNKIRLTQLYLQQICTVATEIKQTLAASKSPDLVLSIDKLCLGLTIDNLNKLADEYNLTVINILVDYYESSEKEESNTRQYYRIITGDNFLAKITDYICQAQIAIGVLSELAAKRAMQGPAAKDIEHRLLIIGKGLRSAYNIEVGIVLERQIYEVCKCGSRMDVIPEVSELHCPGCNRVKTIIGAVFRDNQFYPQEGQKAKHGGYDTTRHYRFWIERLQAQENKEFEESCLEKIKYIIKRDGYDRLSLTCEDMREILKDPKVAATTLNEHGPLLVKIFGGVVPPQLNYQENKLANNRFNKVMRLYDIVVTNRGNKPYYPFFIYKILEFMFKNNPEKLRILDYIHLQSRDTVIKNDKTYERIACLADPDDGIVYSPTDPCGRI